MNALYLKVKNKFNSDERTLLFKVFQDLFFNLYEFLVFKIF